jgi:hemolysin activation/secretion protein
LNVSLAGALFWMAVSPMTGYAQDARNIDPSLQRERTIQQQRMLQEREREVEKPSDEPVIIGPPATGDGELPELDVEFELREIRFSESAFISDDELSAIASEYLNRPVRFADINDMVGRINQLYADQGIISARAVVPPQTVDGGVLEVRLVEGRLGKLLIDGNDLTRESFITKRLPLSTGEVVDIPALREALTRLNRTTELAVQTALKAGENSGETDLSLQVNEPERASAQLTIDNYGTESTGEYRGGLLAQLYGPLGIDDRLLVYGVGSEGAANGLVSYGLPVTRHGTRLELAYSVGDIEIVEGAFAPLDITGESSSFDLSLTQPLHRGDQFWSDVYLGSSWSESTTDISDAALSEFDVTRYTLGVQMQGFGARSYWSFQQGVSQAEAENLFGNTDDTVLFNGTASYAYRLTDLWNIQARGGWQYSTEETVSSPLLFQVGGVNSVRGYTEGALGGARGYYMNLEVSYRFSARLSPFVFMDHGLVDDVSPDRETATSAGIGLAWQYGDYLSGQVSWGQTLEDVLPDQDDGRLNASISLSWAGL